MKRSSPILAAVRFALSGTIAATPGLVATAVGIAHGRVAEPITRCEHGHEVAACRGQVADDQTELHRDAFVLPPLPKPANETIRHFFASPSQSDYAAEADVLRSIQASHRAQRYSQLLMPAWRGGVARVPWAPVAEPLHEPHQPDEHGDELIPLPEALPPGTASAIEAALAPPVRRASLPDDGFMLGTPRALLEAERRLHAHSVDRDESL
jgi:hypothetical protein